MQLPWVRAAPAPTSSASPPRQPVPPARKSAPARKSSGAGVPDASSAGTGLTPGMLAAVPLPPCAEGVPEAAVPQAARPGSFSPPAATGCCEGNAPESRREKPGPPPNPEGSGSLRPPSNPRYPEPGQSWRSCPHLTGEVFPSIGRCRAGLGSQIRRGHPSLRSSAQSEVRSAGTGQNLFGERARTSVPTPGAEGNQSDLPPGSTAACFPTAPGTACKIPASAAGRPGEERWAGAAGPPAAAKGLGAGQVWPCGRAASRALGAAGGSSPGCLPTQAPLPPCDPATHSPRLSCPGQGLRAPAEDGRGGDVQACANPSKNPLVHPR